MWWFLIDNFFRLGLSLGQFSFQSDLLQNLLAGFISQVFLFFFSGLRLLFLMNFSLSLKEPLFEFWLTFSSGVSFDF